VEVVETLADIETNLRQLEAYVSSADPKDREFARSLIRRGLCFVVADRDDGLLFAPSRFVGYRGNNRAAHRANEDKDGKETNPAITAIVGGELVESAELEAAYEQFCIRVGVDYRDLTGMDIRRKYWPAQTVFPQTVRLAEEVTVSAGLTEGAVCQVVINAYERNPIARALCIAHYGSSCVVCGFNFGAAYGPLADGFIHVHHVKPLSEIGAEYEVDPVADLRPVCPNCHAVIHLARECRDIEEVRQLWQLGTGRGVRRGHLLP
jgi:hypothetical protein